ncbi:MULTISPECIES: histidine kinase [Paenibacillus]|uniref:sensor histidine kinase n=1 Tax=Paenibacillus TaxID=44249 RepID=UPI0007BFC186|nr:MULTISPECIES: histidine kinase [Paenibacillus]WDQ31422.1 histidine kinase [Paenibacillus marchantiae]SHN62209.1 two-component system, NarL family, nitrate/nitrite sensor histidine kinase NarQ [Paenibacillus sp. ov031]SLJ89590.1 two-component system, NarL family, nitrate/nitrite sensor histidine kinase NarQ [Paenibacillus sp. RU5A]SOC59189.1 two-component system, NarL family, nitrate/nitrite sensor histidine kinase NarQ [Paenibacillus sp. RU26A]SOC68240.1 two-component system, NarL family, n
MSYKQIKWMILLIPTLTVGLWEYVRHQFLLPYISMNLGNWLTPVIVYVVSITLLTRLFLILERIQKELEHEREAKAALESREKMAKELHDGIAQSLFLLSVKVGRLEEQAKLDQQLDDVYSIKKTVHEVNRYVRQAIADLRYDPNVDNTFTTNESVTLLGQIRRIAKDIPVRIELDWSIPDDAFTDKEKVELLACIREALFNIQKHASASQGWIQGNGHKKCWNITIRDNGKGFEMNPFERKDRYGLKIMRERMNELNYNMQFRREQQLTVVEFSKDGEML